MKLSLIIPCYNEEDFRFASKVEFESDKRKLDFCIALQRVIKCFIQKEYMSAIRDGKLK